MRDIRGDLLVRAKLLEEQIGATQSQFDKFIEQLKLEHQGELEDLKSDLDTVHMVIKTENRLLGSVRPAAELRSEPMPRQQPRLQQAQSQQPTSDAIDFRFYPQARSGEAESTERFSHCWHSFASTFTAPQLN